MGFENIGADSVENNENIVELAEQRYAKAKEALKAAGVEKFVSMVEKNDPVALEFMEALQALDRAYESKS